MKKKLFFTISIILISVFLFPVSLKTISYNSLFEGNINGVRIENNKITLGYKLKYYDFSEENLIFSLEVTKEGSIYVGTGHNGGLYLIKNNKSKLIYKFDKPDIFSLALDKKENLYIATSPMGKIYILKKGMDKPQEFFDPQERFIWDMKVYKGNLYIATGGNSGKLYIVSLNNKTKISEFEFDELNIVKIYISDTGEIFVGGGEKGIVYKKVGERFESIYSTNKKEIRGIYKNTKTGTLYILASGKKSFSYKNKKNFIEFTYGNTNSSLFYKSRNSSGIFLINEKYSFDLKEFNGRIWVATGDRGRVLSFSEKNRLFHKNLEFKIKGKIGFKLISRNGKLYGIYNYPAGIFSVEKELFSRGQYISKIIDMGYESTITEFFIENEGGGKVWVSLRGGNSESPSKDWKDWTPPQVFSGKPLKFRIDGVRYFQFKIIIEKEIKEKAPIIKNILYSYIMKNLPPKLYDLKIKKEKGDGEKYYKFTWKAEDYNKDELTYDIYFQRRGSRIWSLFRSNLSDRSVILKRDEFPQGEFRFKIVAKDICSNTRETFKTKEKTTNFILVDFYPPQVSNLRKRKGYVSFIVKDSVSPIKRVLIKTSLSASQWKYIAPEDGYYDSKEESFSFKYSGNEIFLKLEDAEGNKIIYYCQIEEEK